MTNTNRNRGNAHNIKVGRWGEQLANDYLQEQGFVVMDRNVHTPYGELDLITIRDGQTVIIEVKTRTNIDMGYPEEALTPKKKSHLLLAIAEVLADRNDLPQDWRLDLIAIVGNPGNPEFQLEHFENVGND